MLRMLASGNSYSANKRSKRDKITLFQQDVYVS